MKTLITYKKGSYGDIITEIEALRKTISFVKKEQLADYTNILLLLVDSYYSSKLLTAAEGVARELYENQPDNPDILFRVLRIRNILGAKALRTRSWTPSWRPCRTAAFSPSPRPMSRYDVFLFNQPWIEIALDPALLRPAQAQAAAAGVRGRQDRLRKLCRRLAGKDRDRPAVHRRSSAKSESKLLFCNDCE